MNNTFKCFTTYKGYYAFDRNMNKILKLNKDTFESAKRLEYGEATQEDKNILNNYFHKEFFKKNEINEIEHPKSNIIYSNIKKINMMTLQVTQDCNLRCSYCIYSGNYHRRTHNKKIMTFDIIKRSIEFLMDTSPYNDKVVIGFYGGEPLLEFDNIVKCFNYIKNNYPNKEVSYAITTNGTLLTESIIKTLVDNKVSITISIDGPKHIQNKNRSFVNGKGSFDIIYKNLLKFNEIYPEYFKTIYTNTVVSTDANYDEILHFLDNDKLMNKMTNLLNYVGIAGSKNEFEYDDLFFNTFNLEKFKVFMYFLGYLEKEDVSETMETKLFIIKSIHEKLKSTFKIQNKTHPSGQCFPGINRLFVNTNGDFFPCESVDENSDCMNIGNVYEGFYNDRIYNLLNVGQLTEEECKQCWCFNYCNSCCLYSDDGKNLSSKVRLSYCNDMKTNILENFIYICMLKEFGFSFDE